MDSIGDFNIKKSKGQYILYNRKSKRKGHTHIKTKETCYKLVKWVCNKVVPKSDYLKVSATRISRDKNYIEKVNNELKREV